MARIIWRTVWLSTRTGKQLDYSAATRNHQCYRRRHRGLASYLDAVADFRSPGSLPDLVRHHPFHGQGSINRWLRLQPIVAEPKMSWWLGAIVFQFFSSMYGGYFGAGNGILMLAAMGLLGLHDINRANGIKNFLGICINSIAVVSFARYASRGLARSRS